MTSYTIRSAIAKGALAVMAVVGLGTVAIAAESEPSNKWRIETSGNAQSPGTIELRVTPVQGTPTVVSVTIANDRSENDVARDIRDALRAQLSPDRYDVETDDGEDVLIKKKDGQPDFRVEVASSNVQHVHLELDRE